MLATAEPAPRLAPSSPGLSALIVYLRPVRRPTLVASLTELGLFVHEVSGASQAGALACEAAPPDVVLVVGDGIHDDLDTVRTLARTVTPAVLAVWPDGSDLEPVTSAGAAAAIHEGDCAFGLVPQLSAVGRLARSLRPESPPRGGARVFGTLILASDPPRLETGARRATLATDEQAVLATLVSTSGRPIARPVLEAALAAAGSRDELASGLTTIVGRLRRKARSLGGEPTLLRTVPGFGYVLEG